MNERRRKIYLNLLASLSDSNNVKTSLSLTGPLTFRIICRFVSSRNSTLTFLRMKQKIKIKKKKKEDDANYLCTLSL
jgi:hypothetical protein